jgi:hypothetical protein
VRKGGPAQGRPAIRPSIATCADDYAFGATVTLTAAAAAGSTFEGWEDGPCSGTTATCAVSMTQAQSVTARFSVPPVITPPATPDPVAPVAPVTPDPPAADPVAALSGPITRAVTPTGVVLTAPLQLPEIGRYTFAYLTTQGRRAAILRGSTIGARSLAKRFSAPVLTTTTAASNVKLVVRLRGTAPKNLTLRVVRKDADGSLHDVLLK